MAELIITLKGRELERYSISQHEVHIGRGAGNDLILTNESVSREHAVITLFDKTFYIKALNQSNGLLINERSSLESTPLQNGDRIQIGKYILEFLETVIPTFSPSFIEDFAQTEALSLEDLQRYAISKDASSSRSLDQIRLERTQRLELQLKISIVALTGSVLLNFYLLI